MSTIFVSDLHLAICRLSVDDVIPSWVRKEGFWVIAHTPDELSIVCDEDWVPENVVVEKGWRMMKIEGPLEFTQVGVLVAIAEPLAHAGISIFAISTYDTDYILVKNEDLPKAVMVVKAADHNVVESM